MHVGFNRIIRKRSLQFQVVRKMLQVNCPGFFQCRYSRLRANLPTFTDINIHPMMSKNTATLSLALLTLILLTSCSGSLKISSYKKPDINFSNYKTYAWVAPGDTTAHTRKDDKVYAGFIQHSADDELKRKGLTLDAQNPEVIFVFDTHIDEREELRYTPTVTGSAGYGGYLGYTYGYTGPGYYVGDSAPVYGGGVASVSVEEGTLMYSMYDRKGDLLWRGAAKKTLTKKTNIKKTIKSAT